VKVGVYALSRNEAHNVAAWEASCRDADVRVVTDTGSTDDTVALLEAAGVTVARGNVCPWRWDHAHNLSLHHLPADVDVAVRLDLDETFEPGWRDGVEAAWAERPETTKLRYWYQWSAALGFMSDRIHLRSGYHWTGATHEGLVRWAGEEVQTVSSTVRITHHRAPGKRHRSDLELLRQAVREQPGDARMHWYLARELDYHGDAGAADAFDDYLDRTNGTPTERAYARRVLARLRPESAHKQWIAAQLESPNEPESYLLCAESAHRIGDMVAALHYARAATNCPASARTHASDPRAYGPDAPDLAGELAWKLGMLDEAVAHFREAARRAPADERIAKNAAYLEQITREPGPRAYRYAKPSV
jgi:tetratricopeptide (TPR) repeat protein